MKKKNTITNKKNRETTTEIIAMPNMMEVKLNNPKQSPISSNKGMKVWIDYKLTNNDETSDVRGTLIR